jgi:hypothetical protein
VTGEKRKEEPDTANEKWHCREIISEKNLALRVQLVTDGGKVTAQKINKHYSINEL